MHLVPNRSIGGLHVEDGTTVAVAPQPYIDTPHMSYVRWLQDCDATAGGLIAQPIDSKKRIAVVGAGAAGIVAAYELLKLGADVTVFEASGRHGGRCFSKPLLTDAAGNTYIAELGAMRFPPSEETLFYYINKLQKAGAAITVDDTFPDPGKVETALSYQGQAEIWSDPGTPPAGFETVFKGWVSFCNDGFDNGTLTLAAPATIFGWLKSGVPGDVDSAIAAWKTYIETFSNLSFYDGLRLIFLDAKAPGGTPWRFPDDFERFGALGIGSGGFGPLYGVDFLDIIRLPINGLETNQALVVTGISSVTDALATTAIQGSGRSTSVHRVTRYNAAIVGVTRSSDGTQVELTVQNTAEVEAPAQTLPFDRVIVAATHRSMEITLGLGGGNTGPHPVVSTPAADAIRRLACMSSSKTFVLTQGQFWNASSSLGAQDVVSDTLVRGMYALDYNVNKKNPSPPGVVLLSYVWGADAIKQGAYGTVTTDQDILDPLPQAALFNLSQRRALLGSDIAGIMNASGFKAFGTGNLSPYQGDPLHAVAIDWQSAPYYFGAFKLNDPGQNYLVQVLYYDFLKANGSDAGNPDTYLYLAGDSASFTGGWVEGALQTGLNAAAAVVVSLGGTLTGKTNPFACLSSDTYTYEAAYPLAGASRPA